MAFESLGVLEQVLLSLNYNVSCKNVAVDIIVPNEILEADLLILLGSPISVNQTIDYPWLNSLVDIITKRLLKKRPILGICFGAQLIALIMGARVFPINKKEIGWGTLKLSQKGMSSCLSELENKKVLHWHGETFDLPNGAQLLASTEITENQAFSVENYILGLQFHCEVLGSSIESWLIGHSYELTDLNINISQLRETSKLIGSTTLSASGKMFSRWIQETKSKSNCHKLFHI